MSNILQRTWVKITLLGTLVLVCLYALLAYALSFHTVTFMFDSSTGYIELPQEHTKLYPVNNQPLKLKAGEYTLRAVGTKIDPKPRTITVDASKTISVDFSYNTAHLQSLYATERGSIESALLKQYPSISTLYRIERGQLYGKGDIYGASLVAIDQSSDNADTLRVLLRKKDNTWHVLSRPPAPLLSAPNYPGIPVAILRSINQAK